LATLLDVRSEVSTGVVSVEFSVEMLVLLVRLAFGDTPLRVVVAEVWLPG
jgi:hypothetical protein